MDLRSRPKFSTRMIPRCGLGKLSSNRSRDRSPRLGTFKVFLQSLAMKQTASQIYAETSSVIFKTSSPDSPFNYPTKAVEIIGTYLPARCLSKFQLVILYQIFCLALICSSSYLLFGGFRRMPLHPFLPTRQRRRA